MKILLVSSMIAVTLPVFAQRDIMPRPPGRPVRESNPLVSLVRQTRVGEPSYHKNLVVYPLFSASRGDHGYWTLDQALAKGLIRISEKGEGSVPELVVENRAREPVFLLAGEIVVGGKQNRVISQDILLPPRSGPVSLGVYCVEEGRWTKSSQYFSAESELAHGRLREQLNAPATSQAEVWGEVTRKSAAVADAQPNATQYLGRIYEDKTVAREVNEYCRAIDWPRDANGMAVVIGNRVVGVEIFGDRETFASLRHKLLRSYAVDAIEYGAVRDRYLGREIVEEFLRRTENARLTYRDTIGFGRLMGITGAGLSGTVLTWHDQSAAYGVVHTSLFAERWLPEPPPIVPMPRPLPRYRE